MALYRLFLLFPPDYYLRILGEQSTDERNVTMKAIIIDDEVNGRKALKYMVETFSPDVEVVADVGSVKQGVEEINKHHPDIVFLDIEMPTGSGFSLFKYFPRPDFSVIFATAYDSHAIRAFRFSALDYLLKPIDPEDLEIAINKAREVHTRQSFEDRLQLMMQNMTTPKDSLAGKKVVVSGMSTSEILRLEDIIAFESDGGYTNIYVKPARVIVSSKSLRHFEDNFDFPHFFRIHKSVIINLNEIKIVHRHSPCIVVMNTEKEFEVSRRRRDELMAKLSSGFEEA